MATASHGGAPREVAQHGPHADETLSSPSYAGGAPEISVVISTFRRPGFIRELVGALEDQDCPRERFEVVLVDNGSNDGTWGLLCELVVGTGLRMLVARLETNHGAGGGRNAGVALTRGQVLAFTDDDCIPTAQWLTKLTTPLLGAPGAPAAKDGELGPRPSKIVQGRTVPTPGDEGGSGPWARTVWVLGPTWLFETCNVAYLRRDFDDAGGFADPRTAPLGARGRAFGEDALLGWEIVSLGARLDFEKDALVHHRRLHATYWEWLAELRGRSGFPALARRSALGRKALWLGYFLAPRTAAFDAAVLGVGLALCTGRRRWLALASPWVVLALPEARDRAGAPVLLRIGQLALGDLVGFCWLLLGSLEHRALVI